MPILIWLTLVVSTLLGDVNCDTNVNVDDAAAILRYDVGLISDLECSKNADVNTDGSINPIDSLLILQLEAGLIEGF